ncbi:TM2 domain-containing protein [Hymenobacter sp. BT662]|uniref:TM2 domain-containing protein n=2 Tax=Hymenobacter ruricola TaxID=2791023 RepID=A0ABS0HZS9_9BACT|nr:TM2 domain-containing protein [Hymenobacter ruricola]
MPARLFKPRHRLAASRRLLLSPKQLKVMKTEQRIVGQALARVAKATPLARVVQRRAAGHKALAPGVAEPSPRRSKGIALVLALFLGTLGAHQFYLGYVGRGFVYLGVGALTLFFATLGILGIVFGGAYAGFFLVAILLSVLLEAWLLSDIVRIITGSLTPKDGEYSDRFF